ncbi:unnamed protein product [Fusarium graminearum]|uniref:Uncharacterized protein n=1 Tax=Gibberella zeae (strain ATCC MYA-4620 / CBS 123657 / FGSC 9075 / NRRL 31084 / PH-1) TaxID=229533 RepID=I1S4S2_GIBZE|nr:hypothetical protein FGSG_11840 [Fusarium graminearum PH-1]ESU06083.1 hypothetical protein FGSG_11840 [Fusarium graminearum PH-1]CZS76127.1 unnamed protein product [Fusarium graminearum]|eukprot:XP_011316568.1 hypothetical protein FGSG_11840 [Fusarium graminearum PH-1]
MGRSDRIVSLNRLEEELVTTQHRETDGPCYKITYEVLNPATHSTQCSMEGMVSRVSLTSDRIQAQCEMVLNCVHVLNRLHITVMLFKLSDLLLLTSLSEARKSVVIKIKIKINGINISL